MTKFKIQGPFYLNVMRLKTSKGTFVWEPVTKSAYVGSKYRDEAVAARQVYYETLRENYNHDWRPKDFKTIRIGWR